MNPLALVHYPTNTEADLDRLQQLAEQLGGFDESISLEWLDGAMTALAAGPRPLAVADWCERLIGDAWSRAFADPEAQREAAAVLQTRWNVLLRQLDPEVLLDAPDELRLAPVMMEWTEEDKSQLLEEGVAEEEGDIPMTGEVWAHGFLEVLQAFPEEWPEPDVETEEGRAFDDCTMRIMLLTLRDEGELAKLREEFWPGETLTRDDMIQEALHAAQDLRMYWVENAPKTQTRRIGEQPGRNDPCPCGSGKKFKKCHGA